MKKEIESIQTDQPQNITNEEAIQVGKQMGMAVVAAIVDIGFLRYVGASVETMQQSGHYSAFLSALVKVVEDGLKSGFPGIRARAHMARHMQAGHVSMREKLHEMAFAEDEQRDINVIDSFLETGNIIDKAVRALATPIEQNLRDLCDESKKLETARRLQFAHQQAVMDHIRDNNTECDDPDCDIHKTH
jgi:hypothetical protein